MKRNLFIIVSMCLILAVVMSLGITGCSGGDQTSTTTTSTSKTTTTTTTSTTTTTTSTTTTTTTQAPITVYVSVSVDGELLVAAQPVTITSKNVEAAIRAAHEAFYPSGLSGYTAGINPTWNMYLITQCWGVLNTPYIIVNDAPLTSTVNTAAIAANDNVIICTGADTTIIDPVSLKATVSGNSATVTATSWHLDFATFTYSSVPLAGANVVDSTGASLGTTDANGQITVAIPEDGIVAIEGMAAINVNTSAD